MARLKPTIAFETGAAIAAGGGVDEAHAPRAETVLRLVDIAKRFGALSVLRNDVFERRTDVSGLQGCASVLGQDISAHVRDASRLQVRVSANQAYASALFTTSRCSEPPASTLQHDRSAIRDDADSRRGDRGSRLAVVSANRASGSRLLEPVLVLRVYVVETAAERAGFEPAAEF